MLKNMFKDFFAYNKWINDLKRTNIPVIEVKRGSAIKNISNLPLGFNSDMGVYISYIRPDNFQMEEAIMIEIPINSSSRSHRHIYAEEVIVLSGKGYTSFEHEGRFQQEIDWTEGSYFFIPFNLSHQHFNTGDKPARFLVVTPAPLLINIFRSRRLLYNFHLSFIKSTSGLRDTKKTYNKKSFLSTCFVKDVRAIKLPQSDFIGKDYRYIQFRGSMLRNIFHSTHIGELSSGTYIRAHKHGGEVFIYILSGKGYILLGRDGGFRSREKIELEKDNLINLPPWQYHQVFSTSDKPLRFMAFKGALSFTGFLSLTEIPYDTEDKVIKEIFEEEISASKS